ncbi:galactan 5-O-arabinofuranosyltransferase [Corynebacterium sp. H128]|uniref:galactan 5-O-arabinofuranosyltransferase n=1 Tax=Corynebacterium sp. H128 TaxID=3133427 RepID=UPI0030B0C4F6
MNVVENYKADTLSFRSTILAMFAATVGGAVFTLACWFVLKSTNLPAFGGSYVSRAIATACSSAIIIGVSLLLLWWLRDQHRDSVRPKWRTILTYLAAYLAPAGLVVSNLAIPLSATRLYLDGVTVDQGFRTQFLTRMTAEFGLQDMNYIGLPSFYPGAWFWFGGRFANLLGLPGWEAYQPWALVSIAAMTSALVPLWQRLSGSLPVAVGIALVNTTIFLVMSPEEPYAGIVALGIPVAAVLMSRTLHGSWAAAAGLAIYLGLSAATYTIFTAAVALSVVVITLVYAILVERSWQPIIKLTLVGVTSMAIAAIVWAPYLIKLLSGAPRSDSSATHYLPLEGTEVPLPMLSPTLIGLLCVIGIVFLVFRFNDFDVRAMAVTLIVIYGWLIGSMVYTLAGNTLLGFRLDILVSLLLGTAGVLGISDFRLNGVRKFYPARTDVAFSTKVSAVMVILLMIGGVAYAQLIPNRTAVAIDLAYTDTDGYGERADKFPADSAKYFPEIDAYLRESGHEPTNTVVLTDVKDFLSFHPYYGYQASTSHYANPLGEFEARNDLIESWAVRSHEDLKDPAAFSAEIARSPWRAPDVFILHGDSTDPKSPWKYDLAEDIYPNNPNVRSRGVYFNPAAFQDWDIKQVGPFVVVVKPVT